MAILEATELAKLRRDFAEGVAVTYTKPQINAALQQIEDWFEANRASLGAAITGGWTANQKRRLVKFWLRQKFERE